jgi:hypothetical protein
MHKPDGGLISANSKVLDAVVYMHKTSLSQAVWGVAITASALDGCARCALVGNSSAAQPESIEGVYEIGAILPIPRNPNLTWAMGAVSISIP